MLWTAPWILLLLPAPPGAEIEDTPGDEGDDDDGSPDGQADYHGG